MKKNKSPSPFNFSATEVEAILCALDLVANTSTGTDEQDKLNFYNCAVSAQKLRSGVFTFTANELRVIHVGIEFAIDLLSGVGNEYISLDELAPQWRSDLQKNFIIYNRLAPIFSEALKIRGFL